MKKVIVIMMAMVMVIGSAYAAEYELPSGSQAYDMVVEWARNNGYEGYANEETNGNVQMTCGTLSEEEFETEFGYACAIDNIVRAIRETYDMTYVEARQVGEYEGHPIYMLTGCCEDDKDGYKGHREISILFMICK